MPHPDHYVVLGVPRSATAAEVKGAYRRLAHRFHPDKHGNNPDATRRFQAILEAYQTLNDPDARTLYDQTFMARFKAASVVPGHPAPPPSEPQTLPAGPTGDPVHVATRISLAEVLTGTERTLDVERNSLCLTCRGSGASSKSSWATCTRCSGRGQMAGSEGVFAYARLCSKCHGTGKVVTRPCRACRGRSVVSTHVALRVRVPSGLHEGAIIRFGGQGHAGAFNGPRGDLVLTVTVALDPQFKREGANVRRTVTLTPWQAALGATVPVDLPDGQVHIRVRGGTQPESVVRLPGRGLPREPKSETRGDGYLKFQVAVPRHLSPEQRTAYERLARLDGADAHDLSPSLRQRIAGRFRRRP